MFILVLSNINNPKFVLQNNDSFTKSKVYVNKTMIILGFIKNFCNKDKTMIDLSDPSFLEYKFVLSKIKFILSKTMFYSTQILR